MASDQQHKEIDTCLLVFRVPQAAHTPPSIRAKPSLFVVISSICIEKRENQKIVPPGLTVVEKQSPFQKGGFAVGP